MNHVSICKYLGKYWQVFLSRYVEIDQFVFHKNTYAILTTRFTDVTTNLLTPLDARKYGVGMLVWHARAACGCCVRVRVRVRVRVWPVVCCVCVLRVRSAYGVRHAACACGVRRAARGVHVRSVCSP